MKNLRKNRVVIIFICISILSAISFYTISHEKHISECIGIDCRTCICIGEVLNTLKSLPKSNTLSEEILLITFLLFIIIVKEFILTTNTPITLKVRMDN